MPIAAVGIPVGYAITSILREGQRLNEAFDTARGVYENAQHVYVAAGSAAAQASDFWDDLLGGTPAPIDPTVGRREFVTPDRPTSTTKVDMRVTPFKVKRIRFSRVGYPYVSRSGRLRRSNYRRVSRLGRRRWFRRY